MCSVFFDFYIRCEIHSSLSSSLWKLPGGWIRNSFCTLCCKDCPSPLMYVCAFLKNRCLPVALVSPVRTKGEQMRPNTLEYQKSPLMRPWFQLNLCDTVSSPPVLSVGDCSPPGCLLGFHASAFPPVPLQARGVLSPGSLNSFVKSSERPPIA